MRLTRRQWVALAGGAASFGPSLVFGQAKSPLLIEGKKTLFQRVLTRPSAGLAPKPGGPAGKAAAPFTAFFVYERVTEGGATWLLVGAGSQGKTEGYLREADTVPWRHSITLAFAPPTNRERVLFFRDRNALTTFVNADNAATESQRIAKEITAKGTLGPNNPVIAAEPEKFVDLQKQFYLLPVLEASSTLLKSGHRTRMVKVASITQDAPTAAPPPAPAGDSGISNFNSAVVFVIDASSSMQPYIDRTRQAMEEVLRQAEEGKVGNRIRFGVVAFQDDPGKTPGMEYLSRVFADPNQTTNKDQFLAAIGKVKATKNSTRAYAEDAYAGLDEALRKINWNNFGGRYIVYITDASAREGNSQFASTRMSTDQMRTHAQERGVAIYAMHLKTAEGQKDHAIAEAQFKRLTAWPGKGALYFPVEAGDPAKFEGDVKKMAKALVEQVKSPEKALGRTAGRQGRCRAGQRGCRGPRHGAVVPGPPAGRQVSAHVRKLGQRPRRQESRDSQFHRARPVDQEPVVGPAEHPAPSGGGGREGPARPGQLFQPAAQRCRGHGARSFPPWPGSSQEPGTGWPDGRVPGRIALPEPVDVNRLRCLDQHGRGPVAGHPGRHQVQDRAVPAFPRRRGPLGQAQSGRRRRRPCLPGADRRLAVRPCAACPACLSRD
jgi:hypothetical protein